jgi:hypothetical protein
VADVNAAGAARTAFRWGQSENNRRARYYRLTPAGRKQLAVEVSQFEKVMRAVTRVIQPA